MRYQRLRILAVVALVCAALPLAAIAAQQLKLGKSEFDWNDAEQEVALTLLAPRHNALPAQGLALSLSARVQGALPIRELRFIADGQVMSVLDAPPWDTVGRLPGSLQAPPRGIPCHRQAPSPADNPRSEHHKSPPRYTHRHRHSPHYPGKSAR